jgi:hypothetical protein
MAGCIANPSVNSLNNDSVRRKRYASWIVDKGKVVDTPLSMSPRIRARRRGRRARTAREDDDSLWRWVVPTLPCGLHVTGRGIFGGRRSPRLDAFGTIPTVLDVISMERHGALDAPFPVVVSGPFLRPWNPTQQGVLCLRLSNITAACASPETFASLFSTSGHRVGTVCVVPTVAALTAFVSSQGPLREDRDDEERALADGVRRVLAALQQRERRLRTARVCLTVTPQALDHLATLLRSSFLFAMYARRWRGPGHEYPLLDADTRRRVGTNARPVSAALKGARVSVLEDGVVRVDVDPREAGDEGFDADWVNTEGRLGNMETAHLQAAMMSLARLRRYVPHWCDEWLPVCIERAVDWDGDAWVGDDEGDETLPLVLERVLDRNDSRSCIRRASMHIARSVVLLWKRLVLRDGAPLPEWADLCGWMAPIDLTGR